MLDIMDTFHLDTPTAISSLQLQRVWEMKPIQAAAIVLQSLWKQMELPGTPLLFQTKFDAKTYHPALLEKLIAQGKRRKRIRTGQLVRWERITAPPEAGEIGIVPLRDGLSDKDFMTANIFDKKTTGGAYIDGWMAYHFEEGWTALTVRIANEEDHRAYGCIVVPQGRQDDWLTFQQLLRQASYGHLRHSRKGKIEIWGTPSDESENDIKEEIRKSSFEQVILPETLIQRVLSQKSIFQAEILSRYAALRIPRLRKALLIGPPGTGKTTLLKACAAEHRRSGGYTVYVFSDGDIERSWRSLQHALESAAQSKLPALIVVEDLENFVSEKNMQAILNVLDGVATPDNPAGTLLLASTNAPEKIDRRITQRPGRIDIMIEIGAVKEEELAIRFLKRFLHDLYTEAHNVVARRLLGQVGSHIREVCFLAAIHALENGQNSVSSDDLIWAHTTLLAGRKAAADETSCEPPPAKEGKVGFGNR